MYTQPPHQERSNQRGVNFFLNSPRSPKRVLFILYVITIIIGQFLKNKTFRRRKVSCTFLTPCTIMQYSKGTFEHVTLSYTSTKNNTFNACCRLVQVIAFMYIYIYDMECVFVCVCVRVCIDKL